MAVPVYLRPYLRALWGQAPAIAELPASPSPSPAARAVLADGLLLVPAPSVAATVAQQRERDLAIAAHAGAHLRYGWYLHERGSLKPVQIALVGLLEDARVEAMAVSDLPGLRALWLRFHRASEADGDDVETLFSRLARSLLDPAYDDRHAWVLKGRALFHANAPGRGIALPDAASLRQAASLLGNDLGQMRLQFNAATYVVQPAYRDDNAHLWADRSDPAARPPEPGSPTEPGTAARAPTVDDQPPCRPNARYPEWDSLIRRRRANWVTVSEIDQSASEKSGAHQAGSDTPGEVVRPLQRALEQNRVIARRLHSLLARWLPAGLAADRKTAEEGDTLHLDAVVAARIALQRGNAPDMRVHLCLRPRHERLSVVTLLDASASTACAAGAGPGTVLEAGRLASLLLACALEQARHESSMLAFASNGRHQVVVQPIKHFEERAADPLVLFRAALLESRWSTRMGAALRHAAAAAGRRQARRRLVLLVTDGDPHDVDVHDSRYLLADLRQAVRDSLRHEVGVACVNLGASRSAGQPAGALRGAFAPGAYREVGSLAEFPQVVVRALHCALESAPRR